MALRRGDDFESQIDYTIRDMNAIANGPMHCEKTPVIEMQFLKYLLNNFRYENLGIIHKFACSSYILFCSEETNRFNRLNFTNERII